MCDVVNRRRMGHLDKQWEHEKAKHQEEENRRKGGECKEGLGKVSKFETDNSKKRVDNDMHGKE